ncbi:MAG TPA: hypothetical protein VF062_22250 [Candidatus Limnocylindrales bacterium]
MTQAQRDIKRPPFNQASNNIECATISLRDPDVDNAYGCDVCTHTACRPDWPCETCNVVVVFRALLPRVNQLENRADNGASAIGALSGRVTATESSIAAHTTQISNRPTNAQVNTAITNAVTPVDDKVNTLKTRVDTATAFPIP